MTRLWPAGMETLRTPLVVNERASDCAGTMRACAACEVAPRNTSGNETRFIAALDGVGVALGVEAPVLVAVGVRVAELVGVNVGDAVLVLVAVALVVGVGVEVGNAPSTGPPSMFRLRAIASLFTKVTGWFTTTCNMAGATCPMELNSIEFGPTASGCAAVVCRAPIPKALCAACGIAAIGRIWPDGNASAHAKTDNKTR